MSDRHVTQQSPRLANKLIGLSPSALGFLGALTVYRLPTTTRAMKAAHIIASHRWGSTPLFCPLRRGPALDSYFKDEDGNILGAGLGPVSGTIGPGQYFLRNEAISRWQDLTEPEQGNNSWSQTVYLTPVPAPAALWILVPGLLGLIGIHRRQRG